jgi:hypothetical protein
MEIGTHPPERSGGSSGSTGEAKERARELTRTARERALSTLDERKGELSRLLDRMAETMQEDQIGAYASEYARRGADFLRRQSTDEIFRSVRRGVRSRPGLLLGTCFVAGLAFARLMKGSMSDGGWGGGERYDEERFDSGRWSERGYGESGYREGSWSGPGAADPRPSEGEP